MLYQIAEKVIELEKSGKKIIKFNVGDPDQPTPLEIINHATKAMKEGKTKYGSAAGEKGLREAIAKQYETKLEKVVITPGSKWAIYAIMKVFLKKGDNIILPSPHWTAYQEIARDLGVEVKLLETSLENNWEIDLSKLESLIDEKTKMIIVNNPNNPTSKVIAENTMQEIFEIAEKKGIKILSDECYADISFKKVKSILDFSQEHFFVNSFSKTFAMTGWRLGFAIVPEKIAKEIIRLNQITFTCVPPFIQEAGIKALSLKEEISKEMKKIYKARANLACKILAKTKLKLYKPDAPFYLFPKCFTDSEKLAFDLLDEGIAITPGSAFGDYKDHFRISLTLAESQIREGLQKLREFLER
jgi:aspartate aminotransferase